MTNKELLDIISQYSPNYSIFDEDDEIIAKLKKVIFEKLSESDRRIILLYANYQNLRKVSEQLNLPITTVWRHIKKIQKNIVNNL